ncbi:MAG: hypothetical protein EA425_10220 [Puniceicoccaceae bacterium]|nr:MAG: hypothetical protein EA425_10220 [Puniceicoccaceae bacterium]
MALLAGSPIPLPAHPISLTTTLVDVRDETVQVHFSMMVEDLILYYRMQTDEHLRFPRELLERQARRHTAFVLRHLHLRDRDGNRLAGDLVEIDPSELPEEGVHIDDLMAYWIHYRFEFTFAERPDFLTVAQDFGGEEPVVPAEMQVRVFHHGVLMDTAVLSHGTAHTVPLDWEAGWERAREEVEAARERLRERREETLGITSYSAVYSFLYITEDEVRHELLVPLLTLETWLPLEREDPRIMTVAEQRAARGAIEAFVRQESRVRVDGEDLQPVLERLQFFGPEIRDFAQDAPERDVSVYNARVGLIRSYPVRQAPRQLSFAWYYFDERMPRLRSLVYPFDEGVEETIVTPYSPVFTWEAEALRPRAPLIELPPPDPARTVGLPLVSLLALGLAVLVGGIGWRRGPGAARRWCAVAALALLATAAVARNTGRVEVAAPADRTMVPDAAGAELIFSGLHANLYRAFDYREEEHVYDTLARSVAGPLLETVYLQVLRGLRMEEQGGAVSRIREVALEEAEIRPVAGRGGRWPAFSAEAAWTVTGTVEHWGHVHTRTNRYEAGFMVEGREEGWRITDFDPRIEERVGMQISLRR